MIQLFSNINTEAKLGFAKVATHEENRRYFTPENTKKYSENILSNDYYPMIITIGKIWGDEDKGAVTTVSFCIKENTLLHRISSNHTLV